MLVVQHDVYRAQVLSTPRLLTTVAVNSFGIQMSNNGRCAFIREHSGLTCTSSRKEGKKKKKGKLPVHYKTYAQERPCDIAWYQLWHTTSRLKNNATCSVQ